MPKHRPLHPMTILDLYDFLATLIDRAYDDLERIPKYQWCDCGLQIYPPELRRRLLGAMLEDPSRQPTDPRQLTLDFHGDIPF